jgi:predicted esterase
MNYVPNKVNQKHNSHYFTLSTMNLKPSIYTAFSLLILAYFLASIPALGQSRTSTFTIKTDSIMLFDSARQRPIPVALYQPKTSKIIPKQQLVIFSHGYGANKGGDNVAYSYLTELLASKGYFVVSIQHELPTDSLMPTQGIPQVVRRPFWERGVANILFALQSLLKAHPHLGFEHLALIGHSNGGDMTALFAELHPSLVDKIITLDNRRMALPRTGKPRVYSLRSSDQIADEGVVPSAEEQKKFSMTILKLPNTIHNNMDDHANAAQRKEINELVLQFLLER